MIQLDLVVFLLLIEALVVLAVLLLIWLLRSRKLVDALAIAVSRVRALVKRPDARQYLQTEANLTHNHAHELEDTDQDVARLLAVRADFLQMEHELAENQTRDDLFWDALGKQIDTLLEKHDVSGSGTFRSQGVSPQDRPGDAVNTQSLFEEQTSSIDSLKKQVRESVSEPAKAEVLEKQIDRITSANRELSYCVSTLESEISALHVKIGTLEKQKRAILDGRPEPRSA